MTSVPRPEPHYFITSKHALGSAGNLPLPSRTRQACLGPFRDWHALSLRDPRRNREH